MYGVTMNSSLIENQGLILIMKQQYGARNAKFKALSFVFVVFNARKCPFFKYITDG